MTASSIKDLKASTTAGAFSRSIQISQDIDLVPVGDWILNDSNLVSLMCKWRAENKESFFAQIEPDTRSMLNYLETYSIGDERNLLFIIFSGPHPLGHLGLSNINGQSANLDQVMNGFRSNSEPKIKGLMQSAILALADWGRETLGLRNLNLEVISTNGPAIKLYEKCNFLLTQKIPIKARLTSDGVFLDEDKSLQHSDHHKLLMRLEL